MKVKSDHRSKFSNSSNWKEEAWKYQIDLSANVCGFTAQLVEHGTGSNPVEALIFSGFFLPIRRTIC